MSFRRLAPAVAALLALAVAPACGDNERNTNDDEDTGRPGRPDVDTDAANDSGDGDTDPADVADDTATDAADGSGADVTDATDVADTGDGSGADASDASDVGDATDTAADTDTADAPIECPPSPPAYTGLSATDRDGDPLDIGDLVDISVQLEGSADVDLELLVQGVNLTYDVATVRLDGAPVSGAEVVAGRLTVPLAPYAAGELTVTASVVGSTDLVQVFAELTAPTGLCPVYRSRSGAILQVVGGAIKTPACVDMREVRSVQVAPLVALQNTGAYAAANGRRTDLRADNFIFCPQNPTIVHAAEFCIERDPGQTVTLAGSPVGDGSWEVDDFVLFEVFQSAARIADGFTSQRHNGGSTFWCGEIAQLMCTTPCTAELIDIDESRSIPAIAVAPAQGATARQHVDGAVNIAPLLPADGARADVRITALDQGVEGTLRPGLFLLSSDP